MSVTEMEGKLLFCVFLQLMQGEFFTFNTHWLYVVKNRQCYMKQHFSRIIEDMLVLNLLIELYDSHSACLSVVVCDTCIAEDCSYNLRFLRL